MKTKQTFRLSTALYLCLLLLPPSAGAFYNPTAGKWLSRDPIGEADGPNVYGIVANNPIDSTDGLGLNATDWTKTEKGTLDPTYDEYGGVGFTQPTIIPATVVFPCAKQGFTIRSSGLLHVEWFYSNTATKAHEQHHVDDWYATFDELRDLAVSLEGICWCDRLKAECVAKAIDGELTALYVAIGTLKGMGWDCQSYPPGPAQTKRCNAIPGQVRVVEAATKAVEGAFKKCKCPPPTR